MDFSFYRYEIIVTVVIKGCLDYSEYMVLIYGDKVILLSLFGVKMKV